MSLEKLKENDDAKSETNNLDSTVIELSEGIRKNLIVKNIVKPAPHLPDNFLVYQTPEDKNKATTNNATRYDNRSRKFQLSFDFRTCSNYLNLL